jgi:small GTP-binding protein
MTASVSTPVDLDANLDADLGADAVERSTRRRAVLVGNPNVGKSVVFGALTGTYVTVSNYPGTTVEITRGQVNLGEPAGVWELLDTPGTNNLVPMSEDEAVTRDILLSEPHDALIQVGDAKNLVRTLLMTLQLAELGVPFCLNLNMMDEARARGMVLDLPGLELALGGVRVNATTAIDGEGLDGLRAYLCEPHGSDRGHQPLSCAVVFPADVEEAIATLGARLGDLPVAPRALATMLLSGDRGLGGWFLERVDEATRQLAQQLGESIGHAHGMPPFALLSRCRLQKAQAIARSVTSQGQAGAPIRARVGFVTWPKAIAAGAVAGLLAGLVVDGALERTALTSDSDPLESYGVLAILGRLFSLDVVRGWTSLGLACALGIGLLGAFVVRRHAMARGAFWKLAGAFALSYGVYWIASLLEGFGAHQFSSLPVKVGTVAGLVCLGAMARVGDTRDASASRVLGAYATHPVWGLPALVVVLFYAYKIVGVFGAGSAVDFVENQVFGTVVADARLDTPNAIDAVVSTEDGALRLVTTPEGTAVRVTALVKQKEGWRPAGDARIDVYGAASVVRNGDGSMLAAGVRSGAHARIWSGAVNRAAYAGFNWLGIEWLTAFFVGTYGLLTMGVTYAIAIVFPVVATFFFVFSVLEDSGYLPRLAVMANRALRTMGLNGKAVLPMVLGLGCDTMATLTARIMETKKERVLVTLLLALGIPCSSQLSVIFAMMQRTSVRATWIWLVAVFATLGLVGWVSSKVIPGESSDFLMELPPIRRPMLGNLLSKTLARIEWYLKEAVPLFLIGTALLFFLDRFSLLPFVHKAGEPIVHHVLGFGREGGVSDKVSEALLIGFLRRDFGAAGLLELGRGGRLSAADMAVSMVTITLFIPCIANVFMIVKERGVRTALAISAFIFPYAIAVGALVRLVMR